jgi:dCMP deaminase
MRPTMSDERISKDEMFMRMAEVAALRSTCLRLSVGAIITNWDQTTVVSLGYNGNARGLDNGCDTTTPGACGCIHAELNALLKAPYGPSLRLYTTHSPCQACAKLVLNSSVKQVYYRIAYRSLAGLNLLESVKHVEVEQLHRASYHA